MIKHMRGFSLLTVDGLTQLWIFQFLKAESYVHVEMLEGEEKHKKWKNMKMFLN